MTTPLYFPPAGPDWEPVSPRDAGFDAARLQRVVEFAHARNSSALVVLHRGRLVTESYAEVERGGTPIASALGTDSAGGPIEDVASAQKSVCGVLAGVAQQLGLIDLDDSLTQHLGSGWSKAAPRDEVAITLRHMMSMTSGMDEAMEKVATPDTVWFYNTPVYQKLIWLLVRVAGKDRDALTRDWLCDAIGMRDTRWVERSWLGPLPTGDPMLGLATSARDLARFGLLALARGSWDGRSIVPAAHFDEVTRSSQELNPSYGLLWWVNSAEKLMLPAIERSFDRCLIPSAPSDTIAALGAADRKLYVVPSLSLVVTRLGAAAGPPAAAGSSFDSELWERLLAARSDAA